MSEAKNLAELVENPGDLVRVADAVRGELRRDDDVDRSTVRLAQVHEAPEEGLREHPLTGVPLERERDEVRVVPARTELLDQVVGEDLGAAAGKGNLRPADRDPHVGCPLRLRTHAPPFSE